MFAVGAAGNWVCNTVATQCLFSSAVTVLRRSEQKDSVWVVVGCAAWTFSNFRTAGGVMTGKSRRGFASMDPERQKEIASRGGRAAHEKGTAHEWSSDEARHAGRKGGVTVSRDRAHMAAIGREGGESRSAAARQTRQPKTADRELALTVSREGGGAVSNIVRSPSRTISDDGRIEPEVRPAM